MLFAAPARWLRTRFPLNRPLTAVSGKPGMAHAFSEQPTVFLTDIRLPGIDGIAVTRQMEASLKQP
ncbi:MAG: response regulator [Armatimonadota bacterium]